MKHASCTKDQMESRSCHVLRPPKNEGQFVKEQKRLNSRKRIKNTRSNIFKGSMGLRRSLNALFRLPRLWSAKNHSTPSKLSTNSRSVKDLNVLEKTASGGQPHYYSNDDDQKNYKRGNTSYYVKCVIGLCIVLLIALVSYKTPFKDSDRPQCRPIYMLPSYAKIDGFDDTHSRFSPKYHLYLYREQELDTLPLLDEEIQLDGIPVLFIPGNAGSFKQARSIAAAAAELYYNHPDQISNDPDSVKSLDVFTADFNEDFTAFHGRTMLDQAEYLNDAVRYILSLYASSKKTKDTGYGPLPSSVILLGHSMGGVVARVMPTLANYVPESVNTIITLSSPHSLSPVTFDGDILKIYDVTNKFWFQQYQNNSFYKNNVSIISITGGILDDVLPADYTNIEPIISNTQHSPNYENGFTVYTSTIPGVWTSIDHLAIVWCDQLRKVMAKILLEILDARVPSKTKSLPSRMKTFREFLLSGFESTCSQDLSLLAPDISTTEILDDQDLEPATRLKMDKNDLGKPLNYVFNISQENEVFNFLTSITDKKFYDILVCKNNPDYDGIKSASFSACVSLLSDLKNIPNSNFQSLEQSSIMNRNGHAPFQFLSLNTSLTKNYSRVVFQSKHPFDKDAFFIADVDTAITETVNFKAVDLMFQSKILQTSKDRFVSNYQFPNLWSSLLSYKLMVTQTGSANPLFNPLLKQYVAQPFETKWHILGKVAGKYRINTHNVLPYVLYPKNGDKALKLQLIKPFGVDLTLKISVDWEYTLKLLLLRYRLAIVALPTFLISLLFLWQICQFNRTGKFVSPKNALKEMLQHYFFHLLAAATILTPLCSLNAVKLMLQFLDPVKLEKFYDSNDYDSSFYFLGTNDWQMFWLGPMFILITFCLIFLASSFIDFVEYLTFKVSLVLNKHAIGAKDSFVRNFSFLQILSLAFLLVLVLFFIPYQLVYVIITIMQVHVCMKFSKYSNDTDYENIRNYNKSLLQLFLFVVPVNAPTIIVYLHNFAIKWNTPFRSHHNLFAIFPVIFLVYCNYNGHLVSCHNKTRKFVLICALSFMTVFSLLYGVRYSYFIHHALNFVCCGLLLNTF